MPPSKAPPRDEIIKLYVIRRMSLRQVAEVYDVKPWTVGNWLKKYGIPARQGLLARVAYFDVIDGVPHKRCNGPLCKGKLIPLEDYHKNSTGGVRTYCKRCELKFAGYEQRVNAAPYTAWLESIVRRLGKREAMRRIGINYGYYWQLRNRKTGTIKRSTARKIVKVMHELRQSGEVRHRKSIRHGSALRGRGERPVTDQKDLYVPAGDNEIERRHKYHKRDPDYRRRNNESKRRSRAMSAIGALTEESPYMELNSLDPLELYDALTWIKQKHKLRSVKQAADHFFSNGLSLAEVLEERNGSNGHSSNGTVELTELSPTTPLDSNGDLC